MENNLVTMSNTLLRASYEISLVEKRLLLAFISQIDNDICKKEGAERDNLPTITSDTRYTLDVKAYSNLYNIEYEAAKNELEVAVDKLFQKEVTFTTPEGRVTTRWIASKIKYTKGEHTLGLKWASDIIPFISELRDNFTSYRLRFLSTISSVYALRLYELFIMELNRSYKSHVELTIPVEQLRDMLALGNKYTLFSDFRKRVIEEPINQLNKDKNSNITVSIADGTGKKLYNKKGKQVVSITFRVKRKVKETKYLAGETSNE
jgi:plasmid replication initiation protein